MAGGIPAPTVEAVKAAWMKGRLFAGASERYDTEAEIDAFLAPLKALATRQYAVRWESGEQIGPIGPNEAHDLMADQNPGNPKSLWVRDQILTEWEPA